MNISQKTLRRIEGQLGRLEGSRDGGQTTANHRERWLLAGFKPSEMDDTWRHEDGRAVTYQQVLTSFPATRSGA